MDRAEYFARPEAAKALEELDDTCFALRERGEGEDAFPDARSFLRERGVDPPGGGAIYVRHTVEEPGTTVEALAEMPTKPVCPGGGGDCRPTNCKMIRGQWVCSWICDCP
jgi:hypothetical protein